MVVPKNSKKHKDKFGMEDLMVHPQDMVYKLEKEVMDAGESTTEAKQFIKKLHDAVMEFLFKLASKMKLLTNQERILGRQYFKR